MIKTAILIDGGFIVKRLRHIYPTENLKDPEIVADKIHKMALQHIYRELEKDKEMKIKQYLYRIFFYDCPPLEKKVQYPISKKALDFSQTFVLNLKRINQYFS